MKKIVVLVIILIGLVEAKKGKTEKVGDVLNVLIPALGLLPSVYMQDKEGEIEFLKAYGSTILTTYILKFTVREERPNGTNLRSFPSGHTSSAFSGATFIHKKYGILYALPAYVGSVYTAYSRVHAKKHFTHDVIAGAIIGAGFSWYFTTPYQKMNFTPIVNNEYYGVELHYKW